MQFNYNMGFGRCVETFKKKKIFHCRFVIRKRETVEFSFDFFTGQVVTTRQFETDVRDSVKSIEPIFWPRFRFDKIERLVAACELPDIFSPLFFVLLRSFRSSLHPLKKPIKRNLLIVSIFIYFSKPYKQKKTPDCDVITLLFDRKLN